MMERTIRVTGKGKISVKPDTIRLRLSVEGIYPEYDETLRKSAEVVELLKDLVEQLGYERKELKTERLNKILVSAMKQSLKCTLPLIDEMTPIAEVIGMPFDGRKYIAYCDPSVPRRLFAKEYDPDSNALIMIGPEGDFSPEEINAALEAGFLPISLGDSRLRTETAAVVACAMCHTAKQMK